MSMTKKQAAEVIKFANNVYEMNFDREKAKLWLDMLSENGDYEPTMHTLKKYIKDCVVFASKTIFVLFITVDTPSSP